VWNPEGCPFALLSGAQVHAGFRLGGLGERSGTSNRPKVFLSDERNKLAGREIPSGGIVVEKTLCPYAACTAVRICGRNRPPRESRGKEKKN